MAQINTLTKEKEEKICPHCGQMAGDIEETGGGCAACSGKMKDRSDKEKKDLVNRLSRIEGQIRGIKRMIEEDAYCIDVLRQSTAASAALPPARRASRPAAAACGLEQLTMPPRAYRGKRWEG